MDSFADIVMRLKGVKVAVEPRVSRETIIDILREHTLMIQEIKKDLGIMMGDMTELTGEMSESKKASADFKDDMENVIAGFRDEITESVAVMKKVLSLNDRFQKQMDDMNSKLDEFPSIRANVTEQQINVGLMSSKMVTQNKILDVFIKKSSFRNKDIEEKTTDLYTKIREVKTTVANLADNLVISSNQITVASSAGYSPEPMSLFDVLQSSYMSLSSLRTATTAHQATMTANSEAISKKADESIIFDVNILKAKMKDFDVIMKQEEDTGMNGLRRTCESLKRKVDIFESELDNKVGARQMDTVVHKKYEEIVKYLQDSLQATGEDEKKFKAKIEDFRLSVQKLSHSKADRIEITPMRELLVVAEASLQKLNQQSKEREKTEVKDAMTRTEIECLFETKINKAEFYSQIDGVMRILKKNRKIAALSAGISDSVPDDSTRFDSERRNAGLSSSSITLLSKTAENTRTQTSNAAVPFRSSFVSGPYGGYLAGQNRGQEAPGDFRSYTKREKERGRRSSLGREIVGLPDTNEVSLNDDLSDDGNRGTRGKLGKAGLGNKGGRPSTSGGLQANHAPVSPYKRPLTSTNQTKIISSNTSKSNNNDASNDLIRFQNPLFEGHLATLRVTDPDATDCDLSDALIQGQDGHLYYSDILADSKKQQSQP